MQFQAQDGSIGIRRLELDDVAAYFEAVQESSAELFRWLSIGHPQYRIEETRAHVAKCLDGWSKGEYYNFAVCDAKDGAFLGSIWLNQINRTHNFGNLGYWIRTSRTRQGVARAGVRLVANFGLKELKLNRVEILMAPDNLISQRVAEKAGAQREGLLRKRLQPHGVAFDALMYSLVPEDFDK